MLMIALPMKWFFAISLRTSIYLKKDMGTCWIFKIMNGNIRNNNGTKKLIKGDKMWAIESDWRNDAFVLKCFNISHSRYP
jgi:hypothetical protein